MARFVMNAKVSVSAFGLRNIAKVVLFRRGYAALAPKADHMTGFNERGSTEKNNNNTENRRSVQSKNWWMLDPVTGYFAPESHHRVKTHGDVGQFKT